MIARKSLLVAFVALAFVACSKPPPTEAARKAEQDRIAALAKSAQEEEREKDRQMREEAARTAFAMTAPVSRPDGADADRPAPVTAAPASPEWRGPGPAPATAATPTAEDKAIALATGRIRATLAAPESMRVRSPKTREDNAFVCVEIDARDKSGGYGGFVPVIVTREKILYYKDASRAKDQSELSDYLEFVKLNDRLKCW